MAPASAVATLALGVSIALLVEREQPAPSADTLMNQNAPQPQIPPAARASCSPRSTKAADSAARALPERESSARRAAPVPRPPVPAPQPAAPAKSTTEAFPAEHHALTSRAGGGRGGGETAGGGASNAARDAASERMKAGAPAAAGELAPLRQPAAQAQPRGLAGRDSPA